nr:LysR substrate-binding domain-containing protein [Thiocystis violacea]
MRAWERACLEVAQDGRAGRVLALGCTPDLWSVLARDWVVRLDLARREFGLQIELLSPADLSQRLRVGLLDVAFTFESACDAELELERIGSVDLELLASRPGLRPDEAFGDGYIQVDWGSAFMVAHATAFPQVPAPAIRVSHGLIARDLLEPLQGAAYLPRALAEPLVAAGRLFYVEGAPAYHRRLYLIYRPGGAVAELIQRTLVERREEAV